MPFKTANNWRTTLAAPLAIGGNAMTLAAGAVAALVAQTGSLSPTNRARLTLARRTGGVETAWEIVDATAAPGGDQLTLDTSGGRAKENSSSINWLTGELVEARFTRDMYQSSTSVITREFIDPPRAVTVGTVTINHAFGVVPKIVQLFLECQNTDGGYNPGQIIAIGAKHDFVTSNLSGGVSVVANANNIFLTFSTSSFGYINQTGGENNLNVVANWKVMTRAFA